MLSVLKLQAHASEIVVQHSYLHPCCSFTTVFWGEKDPHVSFDAKRASMSIR